MAEELTFHLEEFEGPLELLLALVSKHKMDCLLYTSDAADD